MASLTKRRGGSDRGALPTLEHRFLAQILAQFLAQMILALDDAVSSMRRQMDIKWAQTLDKTP